MLHMLAALLSGYALGSYVRHRFAAYLSCMPVSAAVLVCAKLLDTWIYGQPIVTEQGVMLPYPDDLFMLTLFQAPLVMLGVYLAHRKLKRHDYNA